MINELYVAVFPAYITDLTEPIFVGSPVYFQRGVSDYYFYFLNTVYKCSL